MKAKLTVVALLFMVTVLSSCKNNQPICIGFSNDLSGSNSALGVESMYGAKLAVDEINEAGGVNGRMIELIIRDDMGDSSKAVEVDNELKAIGCNVIVGHGISALAEQTIDNANDNDILLISPTISTSSVEHIDDNFIRVIPANTNQGEVLADFVYTHSNGKTLVVYAQNNAEYTENVANTFIESFLDLGNDFDHEDLVSFDTNNVTQIQEVVDLVNSGIYDSVVLIGSSFDVSKIIQKKQNTDITVYISVWATTTDIFELSGPNIENTHCMNYYDFHTNDISYTSIKTEYFNRFGVEMSFSAMFTYEAINVIYQSLLELDDFTATNIKNEIIKIETYQGILNEFSINQYGDVTRETYFFQLRNNEFVLIQ